MHCEAYPTLAIGMRGKQIHYIYLAPSHSESTMSLWLIESVPNVMGLLVFQRFLKIILLGFDRAAGSIPVGAG
jgi:hypothetical protein